MTLAVLRRSPLLYWPPISCQKRIDTTSDTPTMRRLPSIATPRSNNCCSSVSITTSRPATSSPSTSGRERCSSIAATRARAYIDRARSALAERQRESEELLQNGVAAFQRGESDEARRLIQAAIDG